ncbi:MAG TPA: type VI secretion system protein TssA [Polyangiaceae bacterium]|nr:type VI secretion system protein TssA [Polyangiaceae bacterium]
MAIDLSKLLEPVSEAEPTGPNLEYDPAFSALERATEGKPERQAGGTILPAEPPEWRAVIEPAQALLLRSKDLRVATHLALALLNTEGYVGLSQGLALVRSLLETYWPTLHPTLDPEEDNDPTMRITALAALATPAVLQIMRGKPVVSGRTSGSFSARDVLNLRDTTATPPDPAAIEAAFRETDLESLARTTEAAQAALEHVRGIDAVFEAQTGSRGPDFGALAQLLHQVRTAVGQRLEQRRQSEQPSSSETTDAGGSDAGAGGSAGAAPANRPMGGGRSLSGEIQSRDDVVRALDKICDYYDRYEPTSPLPLLVQRCRRMVSMRFMDIMKELVPEGIATVEVITGKTGASAEGSEGESE